MIFCTTHISPFMHPSIQLIFTEHLPGILPDVNSLETDNSLKTSRQRERRSSLCFQDVVYNFLHIPMTWHTLHCHVPKTEFCSVTRNDDSESQLLSVFANWQPTGNQHLQGSSCLCDISTVVFKNQDCFYYYLNKYKHKVVINKNMTNTIKTSQPTTFKSIFVHWKKVMRHFEMTYER